MRNDAEHPSKFTHTFVIFSRKFVMGSGFLETRNPKPGLLKVGTHSRVCVPGLQGTGTRT